MALKTLSTFLSPLILPQSSIFNPRIPKSSYTKPTILLCRLPQSQQTHNIKAPLAAETQLPELAGTVGTGAAAPTPGDRFLEHHRSIEAAKLIVKENKKKKKRKEKPLKVSTAVACCYGCGAPLQTSEEDAPGFVDSETYALKKKHHQLRSILCGRCKLLSHGHMITAVGGNGGYSGGKQFVMAEQLREKLAHLRYEKALIVKLVDIVDFNGSFLARVRDLVGANPIILVVTKVDLLPKGTDFNCVGDWVVEATTKKNLNVLSVHLTSSKSLVGITGVASEIQKEKKGRDVYILGSANVGKSAFITALLKDLSAQDVNQNEGYHESQKLKLLGNGPNNKKLMAQKDPVAAAAQRYKPIQSAVPGTTLGPIQINAFLGGGKLYDTPGVHLHHRQAAVVHSEDLPALAPQNRLRGQPFPNVQISSENVAAIKDRSSDLNGCSLFWGGLVRVDVLKVLRETRLTFYGPKSLQIFMVPTDTADEFYQQEVGFLLTPPTGKEKADDWQGLETVRRLQIKFENVERPACDVAISGLGWITIEPMNRLLKGSKPEQAAGELHLAVHVPKPVEIFVRPPMPVGKSGAEWYQYRELTEKEDEVRPKWYF